MTGVQVSGTRLPALENTGRSHGACKRKDIEHELLEDCTPWRRIGRSSWERRAAQGDQGDQQLTSFQLMNNRVLVVTPDGRVTMRPVNSPDMLNEITKDARPMTAGSILIMRDNKLYVAPDRPMQGGTMLSEMIAHPPGR